MKSPQNEIFTAVRTELELVYPDIVYDGPLPGEDTPYPYIYIRDTSLVPNFGVKYHPLGTVSVHIDVWHNDCGKRGTLTEMLYRIEKVLHDSIRETASYKVGITDMQANVINDDTTSMPLLHGYIDATYTLYGGK